MSAAHLDKSAVHHATEAFWDAGVTDQGIEAAIAAYLDRLGLTEIHNAATGARELWLAKMADLQKERVLS